MATVSNNQIGSQSNKYLFQKNDVASKLKQALIPKNLYEDTNSGLTVTWTDGADFSGSTVSGSVFYAANHAFIRKSSPINVMYNTQGRDVYGFKSGDYSAYTDASMAGTYTFVTDAQVIEFDVQCQQSFSFALVVDGKRLADTAHTATVSSGNIRKLIKLDFGSVKVREINLPNSVNFAGIYIHNKYQLFPVHAPYLSMLCIEDSYGGGGYYDFVTLSTMQDIAGAIGLSGVASSAIGGTGYVNRGSSSYKTAYERLRGFVESGFTPDIIATPLGINDIAQSSSAVNAALVDYYNYIKSALPNALCISFGAQAPQANQVVSQPGYATVTDAIRSALVSSGCNYIFINPLNGNIHTSWGTIQDNTGIQASYLNHPNAMITGSSYIGDGSPSGNSAIYINSDRTHPSDSATGSGASGLSSGKAYFSKYVLNAVRKALLSY